MAGDRGHAHFIVCMPLLFEGGYYLKDRFNYEYLILRFGYPSHFAGTNNWGIVKKSTTPTNYTKSIKGSVLQIEDYGKDTDSNSDLDIDHV